MKDLLLGKTVAAPRGHDPSILTPIPRPERTLPMYGFDLWRSYELSWLNPQGRPQAALLEIVYPCESRYLVESKSLKLYLNGLASAVYAAAEDLARTIRQDLAAVLETPWIETTVIPLDDFSTGTSLPPGICLDSIDCPVSQYTPDPSLLITTPEQAEENLFSDLLRSHCPITNQPDWGSVTIRYRGARIEHAGLLRYICSYREHQGFHEECCERIFRDITQRCQPERLLVGCWYTRRGGIDINPVRASYPIKPGDIQHLRLVRQ